MTEKIPFEDDWFVALLACPDCKASLKINPTHVRCNNCSYSREFIDKLNLCPQNPLPIDIKLTTAEIDCDAILDSIEIDAPLESYQGPAATRNSTGFMSELSRILPPRSRVLDLGCGPRDQAVPLEYLGYQYVGFDVSGEEPDFHGDAHAIPFADSVFDCVFSYAVLEHLNNPWLVLQEVERVLKPGGIFIGSVSQGEPFHASYFHMTSWGVLSLFESVPSLNVRKIWGTADTLWSLGTMGRYPRIVKWLIRGINWVHRSLPILAPRRMRWSNREKIIDSMCRAGNICFLVEKTEMPSTPLS